MARPGTRRTRRHRSPASGRRRDPCASRSTSRAASPIAVVVTRRCASGSQACESAPCCDTIRSGPNAAANSGSSTWTAASHAPSPVSGSSGTFTDVPAAAPSPSSPTPPVPGNRYRPVSWNDSVNTPGSRPVDRLDPVAVVDVEVHVQHAQPVPPRPGDRQRRVVVDAEPRGSVGHRVMEPAARMEGVLDVAAQDRLDRPDRAAGDHRPGLVHPRERRIVAALADAGLRRPERVHREPLDRVDVAARMAPQQLVVGGGLGRKSRLGAHGPQQLDPRTEPPRRQRMAGPEVVRRGARSVHQQHRMARYRRWNGSTPRRCSTSSGSGRGCAWPSIDIDDPEIRRLIAERTTDLTEGEPEPETDVVLLRRRDAPPTSRRSPTLASRIRPNGAIWVVSRKGKAATLRYDEILDAAKAAGLIDNKVAAVLGDPHGAPLRHPGRAPTEVASSGTTGARRARPSRSG